ncbi:MAG: hypothetical protein AAGU12_05990 [Clostridiales bacterium]
MNIIHAKAGEGKLLLEAVAIQCDEGVNVYLGGGEKSHIGCVVLCQPRPSLKQDGTMSATSSVLNVLGHKDDGLAQPLARELCLASGQTVVVTAGVHIDNAAAEEIQGFLMLLAEITKQIKENLVKV